MSRPQDSPKTIPVLDLLTLLVRWKRFLFWNTFIISLLVIIYTLALEKRYTSTALLMPSGGGESVLMAGISGNLPFSNFLGQQLLGGGGSTNDIFIAILNSRRLRMATINKFNLVSVYEFDRAKRYYIEDVLKTLQEKVRVDLTENGALAISVQDKSPSRAAAMANYMAHMLDSIYKDLSRERAAYEKEFLEGRRAVVEGDLRNAEEALVAFETEHKAVHIDEQTKAAISTAAKIEALYLSEKYEYRIAQKVYGEGHSKLKELRLRLAELARQKKEVTTERISPVLIPMTEAPELGLQLARLTRQLKIQEFLYELVTEHYEKVKFEEAKNVPTIQLLDQAPVPQKRSYPKRSITVLVMFAISLIEGVFLVLVFDLVQSILARRGREYHQLRYVVQNLRILKLISAGISKVRVAGAERRSRRAGTTPIP